MINIIALAIFFLIIILTVEYTIYKFKDNRIKLFKIGISISTIILIFIVVSNVYASNRLPIILKAPKSYIIDYNETINVSDTQIKLKKVFLDLGSIDTTYSVRGKEKVVAVELKRNPNDTTPIMDVPGLWVGGRVFPEHKFVGMSYGSKKIITPLYLVFYLSNGEEAAFKITDKAEAASAVKAIDIEKTIKYNGNYITFTTFFKGLNYSSIAFESNFNPNDQVEVKLIVNGSEMELGPSGWSGDGSHYSGSFGFDPVDTDKIQIKVINKALNQEDVIDVNLK